GHLGGAGPAQGEGPQVEQLVVQHAQRQPVGLRVGAAGLVPADVGRVQGDRHRAEANIEPADGAAPHAGGQHPPAVLRGAPRPRGTLRPEGQAAGRMTSAMEAGKWASSRPCARRGRSQGSLKTASNSASGSPPRTLYLSSSLFLASWLLLRAWTRSAPSRSQSPSFWRRQN